MTKLLKLAALLCLLVALGAASSAGAADWQSGNTGAYGLTGTTPVVIDINAGAATVNCNVMTLAGTINVSPAPGTNPWVRFATATPQFLGCTTGGVATTVTCAAGQFDTDAAPAAYAGPRVAPADLGVTQMRIQGINCTIRIGGVNCSTIMGFLPAQHTNPSVRAASDGTLIFSGIRQPLAAAKIGGGCAAIPNGAVLIQNGGGAGMLFKYTVPAGGPVNQPYVFYG